MQIDPDLLYTWGAVAKKYKKNETVFEVEELALFYYQIIEGSVRMYNVNEEGKEFTQGLFSNGNSFGEPPLFINETYPATAVVLGDSVILKLSRGKFLNLLEEYPGIKSGFLKLLAFRIHTKALSSRHIINQKPSHRILNFLDSYKKQNHTVSTVIQIPFTRQQIADFTGLRVETVIRTIKQMEKEGSLSVKQHKVFL